MVGRYAGQPIRIVLRRGARTNLAMFSNWFRGQTLQNTRKCYRVWLDRESDQGNRADAPSRFYDRHVNPWPGTKPQKRQAAPNEGIEFGIRGAVSMMRLQPSYAANPRLGNIALSMGSAPATVNASLTVA